jgi:hypothetical protein
VIILILGFLVVAGLVVVGARMLGKQQRLYRQSDGPGDMKRADDVERTGYDPKSIPRAAWDFNDGGGRPEWMRGERDETLGG